MPLSTGTRLGPYEILAPIGKGGMGEVYRARDTRLKREVALKVLPDAVARDPERMARFQREAELLASLNHPNIATIYGVEEGALAMELVDGETLASERDTASRVTLLPGQNQWPVWTPDGQSLVFCSSNPAAPGIYSIRADGSGVAQRLTDGKTRQMPQSISPDGKRLAMTQTSTGGGVEIWTAPVEGDAGHPRLGRAEPFLQTPFVTILPAFSPDGRWLAYRSGEPERRGLWVVPFPGPGGGWLVSSRGEDPIWSPNGRELFFLENGRSIMVAGYTASGDALVFGKPQVWSQHLLMDLGSPPVRAYDLAPDGKRFAVVLNADGTADPKPITHLTFLLNFFDDLRRRVPAGK